MTLNDLEPSEKVFIVNFLQNFALRHAFQEWIAPKWLDIDQDNLRMKFSAWNVDFSSPSPEMDGDRLRLPANRNCYRLSRVSWALLKFLVVNLIRSGDITIKDVHKIFWAETETFKILS